MNKKLLIILGVSALVLSLVLPNITVAGGPTNKATGNITRARDGSGAEATLVFNAHEATGNRPAKGMAMAEGITTPSFWEIDIICVNVISENEAYFGGQVTAVENIGGFGVGDYIMLRVIDGGEPGIGEDLVWSGVTDSMQVFAEFCNSPSPSSHTGALWQVIDGTLQVHYYD